MPRQGNRLTMELSLDTAHGTSCDTSYKIPDRIQDISKYIEVFKNNLNSKGSGERKMVRKRRNTLDMCQNSCWESVGSKIAQCCSTMYPLVQCINLILFGDDRMIMDDLFQAFVQACLLQLQSLLFPLQSLFLPLHWRLTLILVEP